MNKFQNELEERESIIVNLMNDKNLLNWYKSHLPQEYRDSYNPIDHLIYYHNLESLSKEAKEAPFFKKIIPYNKIAKMQKELEPYQKAFFDAGLLKEEHEPNFPLPHYPRAKNISKAAAIAGIALVGLAAACGAVSAHDIYNNSFDKDIYTNFYHLGIPDLPNEDKTKLKVDVDIKVRVVEEKYNLLKMKEERKLVNITHKKVRFDIPYEDIVFKLLDKEYSKYLNKKSTLKPSERNELFEAYNNALLSYISRSTNIDMENLKNANTSYIVEKTMENKLKEIIPSPKELIVDSVLDELTGGIYSEVKTDVKGINKYAEMMYNIDHLINDLKEINEKLRMDPDKEKRVTNKILNNIHKVSEKGASSFGTKVILYTEGLTDITNNIRLDMLKHICSPDAYCPVDVDVVYSFHLLDTEWRKHDECKCKAISIFCTYNHYKCPPPYSSVEYVVLNTYKEKYGIDLPPYMTEKKPEFFINQSQRDNLIEISDLAFKFPLHKYLHKYKGEKVTKKYYGSIYPLYIYEPDENNKIRSGYNKYLNSLEDLVRWYRGLIIGEDRVLLPEKPTSLNSLNITPEEFNKYASYLADKIEEGNILYNTDNLEKTIEEEVYGPLTKSLPFLNTPYITQKNKLTKLEQLVELDDIDNQKAREELSNIKNDIIKTRESLPYKIAHKIESFI